MFRFAFFTVVLLIATRTAWCENWPNWRGPNGNQIVDDSGYPTSWSKEDNIAWKVKLPGWGTSTPAIWDDRIFVACTDDDANKNVLICLDRKGNQLWRTELGNRVQSRNRKASGANPSPVTDGQSVVAYFKSGDLACLGFDGSVHWHKNLQRDYGDDRLNWDLGTSPVLTDRFVVVAVMHAGPSYVVALDKQTGDEAWKSDRDLGAPAESRDSYSTPVVVTRGGREFLIVLGADYVTTYAADDGSELWRVGSLNPEQRRNFRSIASPTVAGEIVIAPYARGNSLTAIHWPINSEANASVNWTVDTASDVPCPIARDGKVFVCGDRGDVSRIDLATGTVDWQERLPRNRYVYSSSPVLVGDNLYMTREDGTTFVMQVGESPKLVATNALRENTYATPAFADGHVYLRTSDYLFCIGP